MGRPISKAAFPDLLDVGPSSRQGIIVLKVGSCTGFALRVHVGTRTAASMSFSGFVLRLRAMYYINIGPFVRI